MRQISRSSQRCGWNHTPTADNQGEGSGVIWILLTWLASRSESQSVVPRRLFKKSTRSDQQTCRTYASLMKTSLQSIRQYSRRARGCPRWLMSCMYFPGRKKAAEQLEHACSFKTGLDHIREKDCVRARLCVRKRKTIRITGDNFRQTPKSTGQLSASCELC